MFTEDVFAFYGGKARFGERVQVQMGRLFVVLIALIAYVIALRAPPGIFNLAVQYAFSGYAALFPLLVGALFWKGSTKWGALAVTIWTMTTVAAVAVFQSVVPATAPGTVVSYWTIAGIGVITRTPRRYRCARFHARRADDDRVSAVPGRCFSPDASSKRGNAGPVFRLTTRCAPPERRGAGGALRGGPRNLDSGLSDSSIVFQAAVPKPVVPKYTTSGVRRPREL